MSEPVTAEAHAEAQRREYSQWVAKDVIYIGGARAFSPGDPVPASHVESGVVNREQVEAAPKTPKTDPKG